MPSRDEPRTGDTCPTCGKAECGGAPKYKGICPLEQRRERPQKLVQLACGECFGRGYVAHHVVDARGQVCGLGSNICSACIGLGYVMGQSDFSRGVDAGIEMSLDILDTDEALSGTDHRALKLALRAMQQTSTDTKGTDT